MSSPLSTAPAITSSRSASSRPTPTTAPASPSGTAMHRIVSPYFFSIPSRSPSYLFRPPAKKGVAVGAVLAFWTSADFGSLPTHADECKDVGRTSTPTSFPVLTSSNAEFDFFCEE